MEEHVGRLFVIEIWQQAINGVTAVELINEGVEGHSERAWLGISALLGAAANISKILWPGPGRERADVVAMTGLDKSAALANRDIRNHFEHIDERIEAWGKRKRPGTFIDTYIGARSGIDDVDTRNVFRAYDPDTTIVSFQGDETRLQDVIDEMERLVTTLRPPWFGRAPTVGTKM